MYFINYNNVAYNSANTHCITTLTTGVMFTKHLPHSYVSQNVIRQMRMSLDSSFNYTGTKRLTWFTFETKQIFIVV